MQRVAVVLLAVGCALVGAVLYGVLAPPPPPAPEPVEVGVADDATHRRLERVEARLEEVVEALATLRQLRASVPPRAAVASPVAPGPQLRGSAPANRASAASAKAPPVSFEDLGNETLENEARARARGKKDLPGALQRWRALLARSLPADEKFSALLGLGRALQDNGELEKAEKAFRQAIDEAGSDATRERMGRLHLSSTLFWKADYRGALAEAETVAASPDAPFFQVAGARWNMVTSRIKLGDTASARRELESMIEDYSGKEGMEPLLRQYRDQLARLE